MKKKLHQKIDALDSTRRLRALMNALPVGITFSTDTTCEYITGNPYLLKQLEMVKGDNISMDALASNVAGRKLRHFINGRQITGAEMPMQRAIAENKQVGPLEIEVELPSGKHWLMEATGVPIHDEKGKVISSVAVNVDLMERKKAELANKLERQIDQEKQKIEFIADATHELRTPLSIIKGNVDLGLRGSPTMKSMRESLEAINEEVAHMEKLLSDLTLLTTKRDLLQTKMSSHQVSVCELLTKIVKRHQAFAKKKRVSLHIENLPEANIEGDERYLERLFSNLIANAILYGKRGGAVKMSGKKRAGEVRIDVSDNGAGISKKDIPHIFDRFYRTESSRSQDIGGTGLGLAIVKWITESHGGTVSVTSKEGTGSTFSVTFPLSVKR